MHILVPNRFKKKLSDDENCNRIVSQAATIYGRFLVDNRMYFFEEYTDHGIIHINAVLKSADGFIGKSLRYLGPKDIMILILSVIYHDFGMHISPEVFFGLVDRKNKNKLVDKLDAQTWADLWENYLLDIEKSPDEKLQEMFGVEYNLARGRAYRLSDQLTGIDRKVIGEFIRRNHTRLAHELALDGLRSINGNNVDISDPSLTGSLRKIIGIVARSHGMNVRETYVYLREIGGQNWSKPEGVNVIYLMLVLRLADYVQIDRNRINTNFHLLRIYNSSVSELENRLHDSITDIQVDRPYVEFIYVTVEPPGVDIYLKASGLLRDIQYELDVSWGILGECNQLNKGKLTLAYRRLESNIWEKEYLEGLTFVPEDIRIKVSGQIIKLLSDTLYLGEPSFGIRELVQNAVDACKSAVHIKEKLGQKARGTVVVKAIQNSDRSEKIIISDNGIGMNEYQLINYFLNVGVSYKESTEFKKLFQDTNGLNKFTQGGKFGVGMLSVFVLGEKVKVSTRGLNDSYALEFVLEPNFESIEIKRNSELLIEGTRIEIDAFKGTVMGLINSHKGFVKKVNLAWTNWYVEDDVDIQYEVNGDIVEGGLKLISKTIRSVEIEGCKVYWSYGAILKSRNSETGNNSGMGTVVLNGFIIGHNASFNRTNLFKDEPFIKWNPNLIIYDFSNNVEISLDRRTINLSEVLKVELTKEVAKYTLMQLLKEDAGTFSQGEYRVTSAYPICFNSEGYLWAEEFFVRNMSENIFFIEVQGRDAISLNINNGIDGLFVFGLNFWRNAEYSTNNENKYHYILDNSPNNAIMVSSFLFEKLSFEKYKRGKGGGKEKRVVLKKGDSGVLLGEVNYKGVLFESFDRIVLPNGNFEPVVIYDRKSYINDQVRHFGRGRNQILHEFLEKYIGDNVVIPYDYQERRKLYSQAFVDLYDYSMV